MKVKFTKATVCALIFSTLLSLNLAAQGKIDSKWYVGLGGGWRTNAMKYSDIDKDIFPTNKNLSSGLFSVFVQGEFGSQGNFAIRPQLSFLNRGGKLTEIYNTNDTYELNSIDDINYTLKAHYIDIRVPLIYNFGQADSKIRPYAFIAPVLGFCTGGSIKMQTDYTDLSYAGYKIDASKANMASTYFAGQIGVGAKLAVSIAGERCYVGIEADYELGFTDTYGSKEKNGDANDVTQLFSKNYQINGNRKFSGFEIQVMLSVPFSIFSPKPKKAAEQPIIEQPIVVEPVTEAPKVEEKSCYTLEEIIDLMVNNQSVEGKTICAVDVITFDFSKSTIKPESHDYLDKLAATLIRTNKRIEVKGHTDNIGSKEFNMNLSRERAEAVVNYLVKKGVDRNKLTYTFFGMSKPLASNDTEEGRATNRRVEFTILNNF